MVYSVVVTDAAACDLDSILNYLVEQLHTPKAAVDLIHVGAGEIAGAAHQHRVVPLFDRYAHFQQLGRDALQMLGDDVFYQNLAAGGSHGGHVSARLDLIGNDGIIGSVQMTAAAHADDIRARAFDAAAHRIEKIGQIDDVT